MDDQVTCPLCEKKFKATLSGGVRKHKCVDSADDVVRDVPLAKPRNTPRRKKGDTPEKVLTFTRGVIATGIEWGSEQTLSRVTGVRCSEIPEEVYALPDDAAMIDPLVKAVWPKMPPTVQKVMVDLADHEDVIAAMFLWYEWQQSMRTWAEKTIAEREAQDESVKADEPVDHAVQWRPITTHFAHGATVQDDRGSTPSGV
jgi:hypothetical protein